MQVKPFFEEAKSKLSGIYSASEAQEIAFMLIHHLTNFSKIDLFVDKSISEFNQLLFESLLERLLKKEPIQYVLGYAEFLDYRFKVNEYTLIPRPETEELVMLIGNELASKSNLRILDIGTGTGCIPISLQLQYPTNEFFAVDISSDALIVAKANAVQLHSKVEFLEFDILSKTEFLHQAKFDIIVSNPPYVLESDKLEMYPNVLDYEPELALFVPDSDALKFYRAIVAFAKLNLKEGGRLFFEIHEKKGQEMDELMKKNHFYNTEIRNDFNNKARFAIGTFTP